MAVDTSLPERRSQREKVFTDMDKLTQELNGGTLDEGNFIVSGIRTCGKDYDTTGSQKQAPSSQTEGSSNSHTGTRPYVTSGCYRGGSSGGASGGDGDENDNYKREKGSHYDDAEGSESETDEDEMSGENKRIASERQTSNDRSFNNLGGNVWRKEDAARGLSRDHGTITEGRSEPIAQQTSEFHNSNQLSPTLNIRVSHTGDNLSLEDVAVPLAEGVISRPARGATPIFDNSTNLIGVRGGSGNLPTEVSPGSSNPTGARPIDESEPLKRPMIPPPGRQDGSGQQSSSSNETDTSDKDCPGPSNSSQSLGGEPLGTPRIQPPSDAPTERVMATSSTTHQPQITGQGQDRTADVGLGRNQAPRSRSRKRTASWDCSPPPTNPKVSTSGIMDQVGRGRIGDERNQNLHEFRNGTGSGSRPINQGLSGHEIANRSRQMAKRNSRPCTTTNANHYPLPFPCVSGHQNEGGVSRPVQETTGSSAAVNPQEMLPRPRGREDQGAAGNVASHRRVRVEHAEDRPERNAQNGGAEELLERCVRCGGMVGGDHICPFLEYEHHRATGNDWIGPRAFNDQW